jgi:hypothetical protein
MKWFRRPPAAEPDDKPDVEQARRNLDQTKANWPRVLHLSGQLRELRERNHLAEAIRESMGGRP